MFYIYILISESSNKYYVGCTDNMNRRFMEHNNGLSKYTKHDRPWRRVYQETYGTLSQARKREKQIKSWKSRSAIEKLINAAFV